MDNKKSFNWIIGILVFVVVGAVSFMVYYEKTSPKVLTKTEYVKEVIVQNKQFEEVLDNFLDQVFSFNSTKEAADKLENTAAKFPDFVEGLKTKLEPRVPHESKEHYKQMMEAYRIYLEAIEMYKNAVLKYSNEERSAAIDEAKNKLQEARSAMKNIK